MSLEGFHLGLPMWGMKEWSGTLYSRDARPADFLEQYARVFNAVEGNTTFYSVPSPATVERWARVTPPTFRFCCKLPSTITHERRLEDAVPETVAFLARLEPLGSRLGPVQVQLPPSFGPRDLRTLEGFLRRLPSGFRYAVELRHPALFTASAMAEVDALLVRRGAGRVLLDSRPLRSGSEDHPEVRAARHKKPDLPVLLPPPELNEVEPILRLITHPEEQVTAPWIERWVEPMARWIEAGRRPYWFAHTPSNVDSPQLARRIHEALVARVPAVGSLPTFLGEDGEDRHGQMSLL